MKEARRKSSKTLENANQSIGDMEAKKEKRRDFKGTQKLFGGGDKYIHMLSVVMGSWVYTHVKIYQIVHFKCVQLMYVDYTLIEAPMSIQSNISTMLGLTKKSLEETLRKKKLGRSSENALSYRERT